MLGKTSKKFSKNILFWTTELTNTLCKITKIKNSEKNMVDLISLMYVTFFLNQVMHVKYSNYKIEVLIRTKFLQLEDLYNKNGNNLPKNYFITKYIALSKTLHEMYIYARANSINEFDLISEFMLKEEFNLTIDEFESYQNIIPEINTIFLKIINLDKREI